MSRFIIALIASTKIYRFVGCKALFNRFLYIGSLTDKSELCI